MKNIELFKEENGSLLIIFEGDSFDKPLPSIIIERYLCAFRRHAEEWGLKEDEILIKIGEGSLRVSVIGSAVSIIASIIFILSADYSKIGSNVKSLTGSGRNLIRSLLEPIEKCEGSEIFFKEGETNKKIKSFKPEEAKKILALFPDEPPVQELILQGEIFGVKKDARFSFKTLRQREGVRLSFSDPKNMFAELEDIRGQLGEYVEIKGMAKINKNGVITSMVVREYKKIPRPQQKLNLS